MFTLRHYYSIVRDFQRRRCQDILGRLALRDRMRFEVLEFWSKACS